MLLAHYAMGRDSSFTSIDDEDDNNNNEQRQWNHHNTFSVYPVYYWHDMNGRASTRWNDVVFRTGSCFASVNKQINVMYNDGGGGGDDQMMQMHNRRYQGDVQCRWGVRMWEEHVQSIQELVRMVAHELGHCLGLGHPYQQNQPRRRGCQVVEDVSQVNLMQQQRSIAMKKWVRSGKCKCSTTRKRKPSCGDGDCGCEMNNEFFEVVAKSTRLDREQIGWLHG
jgi:hypothetical protein